MLLLLRSLLAAPWQPPHPHLGLQDPAKLVWQGKPLALGRDPRRKTAELGKRQANLRPVPILGLGSKDPGPSLPPRNSPGGRWRQAENQGALVDSSGLKTFGQEEPHCPQATRHTSSKLPFSLASQEAEAGAMAGRQ